MQSSPRGRVLRFSVTAAALVLAPQARAANGTWSTTVTTGAQAWSTTTNWASGIVADGTDANAIFNVDLAADQTISIAGGRTIGNLFAQDPTTSTAGGYSLGVPAETGPLTLDVSSGRSVIDVGGLGSSKKLALFVPMINADGILKIGGGQLTVRADSPGLTGDLVLAGGLTDTRSLFSNVTAVQVTNGAQFQVDFANSTSTSNLLNPAAAVTLGGLVTTPPTTIPPALPLAFNSSVIGFGTFTVTGKAAIANDQTINGLALNVGTHTVNVANGGAGATATLNLGTISRNGNAGLNFVPTGAGTSTINTTTANTSGAILAPWATMSANTWVVSAGSAGSPGAISPLPAASYSASLGAGAHTDVTSSFSGSGPTETIRFNTAAALTLTLTGLTTVNTGGILNTATVVANASTITGGALTSGTSELVLNQYDATAGSSFTINSPIQNGATTLGVTKVGATAGVATLGGVNTYTGPTIVNGGTLQLAGDSPAATGPVQINVGTFQIGAGGSTGSSGASSYTVGIGAALSFNRSDNALVISAPIANSNTVTKIGAGLVTITGNITGAGTLNASAGTLVMSGDRTYTGQTNVAANAIVAVATDGTPLGTGNFRFNVAGGILRSADTSTRTVSNFIDVATDAVIGAAGTGDIIFSNTFSTGSAAKILTINNTTTTVTGIVTGGASTNLITKAGPGTLIFANPGNTFIRPITINAGTIQAASEVALGLNPAAFAAGHLTLNGGILRTTANFAIDDPNRGLTLGAAGGTFSPDGGTTLTVANKITGVAGNLTTSGPGTLALTAINDYNGTTTITAGTLLLSGTIASSSQIALDNAGTLILSDAANSGAGRLLDTAALQLGSATAAGTPTLALDSGVAAQVVEALGALTLSSNSIIDFGTNSQGGMLTLSDSSAAPWSGTLSVYNWSGNSAGTGIDQLYFGNSAGTLTPAQLSQIKLFADSGTTNLGPAGQLANGQVVVVPEPSSLASVFLAAALLGARRPRRQNGWRNEADSRSEA